MERWTGPGGEAGGGRPLVAGQGTGEEPLPLPHYLHLLTPLSEGGIGGYVGTT